MGVQCGLLSDRKLWCLSDGGAAETPRPAGCRAAVAQGAFPLADAALSAVLG